VKGVVGIFAMGSGDNAPEIGGDFANVAGSSQQGFALFRSEVSRAPAGFPARLPGRTRHHAGGGTRTPTGFPTGT
jgi:hypothetical protein